VGLVFIIGSIQAFIFLLLLLTKKQKLVADKILAVWFAVIALHLLIRYIYSAGYISYLPHLLGTHIGFPLLYGPLLLIYVESLTNKNQRIPKINALHFIPFIVVIVASFPLLFQTAEYKLDIINGNIEYKKFYLPIIMMQLLTGPVYVVWVLLKIKRHKSQIGQLFSYTEKIELKWLKNLTISLAAVWFIIFVVYIIWELFDVAFDFEKELIIYTGVTVFVFFIGFKGLKQSPAFSVYSGFGKEQTDNDGLRDSSSGINKEFKSEDYSKQEVEKLIKHMDEKKPYLEEKLMLSDIAHELGMRQYKLTKLINDEFKMNFFNFINSYRIEEVKKQLINPKNNNFTVLAIAFDCGFSSKASFNRIFKKMMNQTPSEYRNAQKTV
jgi:AraC-like DNA-binding protein